MRAATVVVGIAFALTLVVVGVVGVSGQQPGFKRTVLQERDLSVPGRQVVTAMVEFQPGATVGRHTHPGEEAGYVMDGSIVLEQDGQPAVTLGAGMPVTTTLNDDPRRRS